MNLYFGESNTLNTTNPESGESVGFQNVYGKIISVKDLTCNRPGTGITPEYWDQVVGSKVLKSLQADHVLEWQDLYKPITSL